jgi:hypothetical protein
VLTDAHVGTERKWEENEPNTRRDSMIEIPEEGLRIWVCSNMSNDFSWGELTCKPEECQHLHGGLCRTWGIRYGLCDAQAYRITKANP